MRNLSIKLILTVLFSVFVFNLTTRAQEAELVVQTGHSSSIESVAFSPDGKILASSSGDTTIKLWDVESGKELRTLSGHNSSVQSIAFSLNGKILASGSYKTIKLWDVETGKELRTLLGHSDWIASVTFSHDWKILASGSWDHTIKLWDVESGKELRTLSGHSDYISSVSFSRNGKTLASGSHDKVVKLWDVKSGKELRTLSGHSRWVISVSFSPNGKTLASGSEDKTIKLWDVESGKELRTITGRSNTWGKAASFSPDGKVLAFGSGNAIKLLEVASGRELMALSGHTNWVVSVSFSPNGKILASLSWDNTIKLWDVESGKELSTLSGHSSEVLGMSFSTDGKILASGSRDKTIKLWDVESGNELKTLTGHSDAVFLLSFSQDGKILASRSWNHITKLWDVESGKELESLDSNAIATKQKTAKLFPGIYGAPVSERLIAERADNVKIKLFEKESYKEIATLIALNNNDWVVVNPDGLFDASSGARKLMHYVIGLEPITLEQMKDVYYVPGLLQKIFKGEPLPKVELFGKQDLFPRVEYEPLKPNKKQLTVKLTNRGGGIGQVQVLFNGKELVADARPTGFNPNSPNANLTIDLSKAAIRAGEENKIEVVARNAAGSLSTRDTREAEFVYKDESKGPIEPPNIYAIVGGISDYTGERLKLNFAAKDAEDFAHALELGAIKLLNGDKTKVHIRLLTSNGDKANIKFNSPDAKISTPTKANFERAFSDFRNATSKDVFIVYLAGHGIALNLNQNPSQAGGDTYLYLTQEATTTDKSVLAVENSRKAMAISSEELKELMKQNKALKQVLILDTCAAGALSTSLAGKRDLPSDQIRAIERLKDNTGFFVLMGASADAVSYEASQYGQGLLTYSLLQGMKGARLRENQFADVSLLFGYAQETVPQMAKNVGGIQRPLIITPDTSASFDIGKFTTEEQKLINLSNPKPIILRPSLRNAALRFDNLKLTQMMTEQLRQASYVQVRGEQGRIVFVEADEMTDAVQPVGDYTIEGDTLKFSMILVKNNVSIGKEISATGKAGEPEKVIAQLVEAVMRSLP